MKDGRVVVGLVGYGYWGPNILRNYMECSEALVKYVCDKDRNRLLKAKARYPAVTLAEKLGDVLGDAEVDAVLIATPIATHYQLARRALLADKHVFVEKPMAASSKEAEALVALARHRERTLMVGHTFEYSPPVVKTKELIDSGELGEVYYVSSSRVNLGLHQPDMSVVWDLAPHDFSILYCWLGEEATRISAFGRSCVGNCVPDVAFVNLAFESGAVAQVQLSWLSPIKLRRTIVVGSKKMLMYDDTEAVEKIKIFDHGVTAPAPSSFGEFQLSYRTGDIVSPHLENSEPLQIEAKHFIDCVANGRRPQTDGLCGLRVVRALERAEASLNANSHYLEAGLAAEDLIPLPAGAGGAVAHGAGTWPSSQHHS